MSVLSPSGSTTQTKKGTSLGFLIGLCRRKDAEEHTTRTGCYITPLQMSSKQACLEDLLAELDTPSLSALTLEVHAKAKARHALLKRLVEQSDLTWQEAEELSEYKESEEYKAYDAAKRQLPVAQFMSESSTSGCKKADAEATDNSLGLLDIDYTSFVTGLTVDEFVDEYLQPHFDTNDRLLAVHRSASLDGIHIVYRRSSPDIWQSHMEMAASLGIKLEWIDNKVKNPGRSCFLTSREDWLYINKVEWERGAMLYERTSESDALYHASGRNCAAAGNATPPPPPAKAIVMTEPAAMGEGADGIHGVAWQDFIGLWLREIRINGAHLNLNGDGHPCSGIRNDTFFRLALHLLHLTDGNVERVWTILRETGHLAWAQASGSNLQATMQSALNAYVKRFDTNKSGRRTDNNTMPRDLASILRKMDEAKAAMEELGEDGVKYVEIPWGRRSCVPHVIQTVADCFSKELREPKVLEQLPELGTLGGNIRSRRTSTGKVHSPNFQVVEEAPTSSGKGTMNDTTRIWLRPFMLEDNEQSQMEMAYRDERENMKNQRDQPRDPKYHQRILPADLTMASLNKNANNIGGKMCLWMTTEISELRPQHQSGYNVPLTILRKAFDNEVGGQMRAGKDTFTGKMPVCLCALFAGTPSVIDEVFGSREALTQGDTNRILFTQLPDNRGRKPYKVKPLDDEGKREVEAAQRALLSAGYEDAGLIGFDDSNVKDLVPKTDKALEKWVDGIHTAYNINSASEARENFCRRASDMGYRAAMIAYVLNNCHEDSKVIQFGLLIAELALQNLLMRFGQAKEAAMREEYAMQDQRKSEYADYIKASNTNALCRLTDDPEGFDVATVQLALDAEHNGKSCTMAKVQLKRWLNNGQWVEKIGYGRYRKTAKGIAEYPNRPPKVA